MRRTRRPAGPRYAAAVSVAAAALLTGCSFTNPATVATPYAASDGTAGEVVNAATGESVKLRNFLLVGTEQGAGGVLAGAIANDGTQPVSVRLTVLDDADPAQPAPIGDVTVQVAPGELALVGPGGEAFDLASVPVAPGAKLLIEAATPGGSTRFPLPVVAAANEYATLTPAAPSPSATS